MQQSHKGKRIYIRRIDAKDIDYGDDSRIKSLKLPTSVNLTSRFPHAFDQGALGSCVAQAFCALYGYNAPKKKKYKWSRLYLYYIVRKISNIVKEIKSRKNLDSIR